MEQGPSEPNNNLTGLQKFLSGYHREAEMLDTANGGITVLLNVRISCQSTWL